ncbi:hypothetical protein S83_025929 [Arachis hypogaea]
MAPTRIAGIFLCLLIIIMDVVAGILGLKAEIAQKKGHYVNLYLVECKQQSQKAFQMGFAALILLGIAHAIVCLLAVFSCFCSRQGLVMAYFIKQISMVLLLLAWITFAIGMILLHFGTKSNHHKKRSCGFSDHHFLYIGGISCFVHGACSALYYGFTAVTII